MEKSQSYSCSPFRIFKPKVNHISSAPQLAYTAYCHSHNWFAEAGLEFLNSCFCNIIYIVHYHYLNILMLPSANPQPNCSEIKGPLQLSFSPWLQSKTNEERLHNYSVCTTPHFSFLRSVPLILRKSSTNIATGTLFLVLSCVIRKFAFDNWSFCLHHTTHDLSQFGSFGLRGIG